MTREQFISNCVAFKDKNASEIRQLEDNIEYQKREYQSYCNNRDAYIEKYNRAISEAKAQMQYYVDRIEQYERKKVAEENFKLEMKPQYDEKIKEYQDKINALQAAMTDEKVTEKKSKLVAELEKIKKHGMVTSISTSNDDNRLDVYVEIPHADVPDLKDKDGNVFRIKLGKIRIGIFVKDNYIRFYPTDEYKGRPGYWSRNYDNPEAHLQVHPHVSTNGQPCLGNMSDTISVAIHDLELYWTVLCGIEYLMNVNIDDCAGKMFMSWDCIDTNGSVIQRGNWQLARNFRQSELMLQAGITCESCGTHHEDTHDVHNCPDCGNHVCPNCGFYIHGEGYTVCEDCYNDHYTYCDACDDRFAEGDVHYVQGTRRDRYLCADCRDDLGFECVECGGNWLREDMFLLEDENGEHVKACPHCKDKVIARIEEAKKAKEQENVGECQASPIQPEVTQAYDGGGNHGQSPTLTMADLQRTINRLQRTTPPPEPIVQTSICAHCGSEVPTVTGGMYPDELGFEMFVCNDCNTTRQYLEEVAHQRQEQREETEVFGQWQPFGANDDIPLGIRRADPWEIPNVPNPPILTATEGFRFDVCGRATQITQCYQGCPHRDCANYPREYYAPRNPFDGYEPFTARNPFVDATATPEFYQQCGRAMRIAACDGCPIGNRDCEHHPQRRTINPLEREFTCAECGNVVIGVPRIMGNETYCDDCYYDAMYLFEVEHEATERDDFDHVEEYDRDRDEQMFDEN